MNIQSAYDQWSANYDSDENLTRNFDQQVTRETFEQRHFHSVLELGCGTGKNTAFFVQIADAVHALDFSEGMIAKARAKVQSANVHFEMADLTKGWPCEDAAYDLVSCNLVLEHIENLHHIFAEAARVMEPKGLLFINELHPFKQYGGTQARFQQADETVLVPAFVHHLSDFIHAAQANRLKLVSLNELWHFEDKNRPPRLASFLFMR